MDEKWLKPTAEELAVNGECTAYSGADANRTVTDAASPTISSTGPLSNAGKAENRS
jgi:hypothetical protein